MGQFLSIVEVILHRLFQIIILILIFFSLAKAEDPNYWRVKGIAFNDVLWIHPTPSYLSKVIGKIPYSAVCLKKLECTPNISLTEYKKLSQKEKNQLKYRTKWCKVVYYDTTGWVNDNYLTKCRKGRKCPLSNRRTTVRIHLNQQSKKVP